MALNKFHLVAAGSVAILLAIGVSQLLPSSAPTQKELDDLKAAMPALATQDFARLAKDSPSGSAWTSAHVVHVDLPFEDWYGFRAHHSLKVNLIAKRLDGATVSTTYRVALDNRSCTKEPKNCASLSGWSVVEP